MDWNNNNVLEFIELLQNEPTIWDPKKKSHKNRLAVSDAWERIKNLFSLQCSVEELKKKRNSLMAAYRDQVKKIKDSCITGSGMDEVYKPTWFAFDAMHSFLGPVYEYNNTINTEEQTTSDSQRPSSRESDMGSGNESQQYERGTKRKSIACTKELLQVKKQMDEAFSLVKQRNVQKQIDEDDLFGQLVAQKLKKMNEDDKLMLTHDIYSLIFKYEMKARSRLNKKSTSSRASTLNNYTPSPSSDVETVTDNTSYTLHIPGPSTSQYECTYLQAENSNTNMQSSENYLSSFSSTENLINLYSKPVKSSEQNVKILSQIISPPARQLNQDIISQAYAMSNVNEDSD